EGNSVTQVQLVGDPVEVSLDLLPGGHELGPVPLLLEVWELREHVLDRLDVDACTWIAVPVPGPAQAVSPLEHPGGESGLAHLVQAIEPGETRSDDHDVHIDVDRVRRMGVRFNLCHDSSITSRGTAPRPNPLSTDPLAARSGPGWTMRLVSIQPMQLL